MPAFVERRGNKFRVVERTPGGGTRLVIGPARKPVDGGGFSRRVNAQVQAAAINSKSAHGKKNIKKIDLSKIFKKENPQKRKRL